MKTWTTVLVSLLVGLAAGYAVSHLKQPLNSVPGGFTATGNMKVSGGSLCPGGTTVCSVTVNFQATKTNQSPNCNGVAACFQLTNNDANFIAYFTEQGSVLWSVPWPPSTPTYLTGTLTFSAPSIKKNTLPPMNGATP